MKVISMVSWKGGTGKTTLACNLAERAVNSGLSVMLCDFDPQESALQHCLRRQRQPGMLKPIDVVRANLNTEGVAALEDEVRKGEQDLVICDTPGGDDIAWDRCADLADLLLVPLAPSPYEVVATRRFLDHGLERQWNVVVVLNNLPTGRRRIDELRVMLNMMEVPVAPVNLARRVDYWDAGMKGMGVCEAAPKSAASRETGALWDWVVRDLGLSLPEHSRDQEAKEKLA